jgi:hypothetical protein
MIRRAESDRSSDTIVMGTNNTSGLVTADANFSPHNL